MQSGRTATQNGKVLEQVVASVLNTHGFQQVRFKDWEKGAIGESDNLLLTRVPFTTIYGSRGHTEFLLKSNMHHMEIRIECKWQQCAGSVDEKFPYLFLNCSEAMPEKQVIIVLDGGGAKPSAIKWLKDRCDQFNKENTTGKTILALSSTEFQIWANKTLPKMMAPNLHALH